MSSAPCASARSASSAERRQIAVHAEHALGDDERPARARCGQGALDRIEVQVRIDELARAGHADAVDQAGVIERVGEDQIVASDERRQQAEVGAVARAEEQRGLAAAERGQARSVASKWSWCPRRRREPPEPAPTRGRAARMRSIRRASSARPR